MALYKQHNVNPVAGCLPILLQMPIWIALYRMLSNAGELYQQPFIPGWIEDLTATDPVYVLPGLLVVTMFLQARLQPATADSRQQKFLQYGMPLMFGVMSFFFPSGLTIYIFTNTVLSALHSIYMNKFESPWLNPSQMSRLAPLWHAMHWCWSDRARRRTRRGARLRAPAWTRRCYLEISVIRSAADVSTRRHAIVQVRRHLVGLN